MMNKNEALVNKDMENDVVMIMLAKRAYHFRLLKIVHCGRAQALAAEPKIETSRLLTHKSVIAKMSEKIIATWFSS